MVYGADETRREQLISKQQAPHSIWTNPIHFIACGFGIGACPFFPGTVATACAIPLYFILSNLSVVVYCLACIIFFCIGIYLCGKTNQDFKTHDHSAAVFDEIATFPVTLIAMPMTWYFIVAAFLLFRFFDIVKPGPIGWADKRVPGGLGVMLDDLLAALATLILLQLIRLLILFSS